MRIRFIGSGSSGNATLVQAAGRAVLLDAGLPPSRLEAGCRGEGLDPARLDGVFLSHEHSDHSGGAAAFSARHGLTVFRTEAAGEALARARRPLRRGEPMAERTGIGALSILAFPVPHDAPNVGFRIESNGTSVGIVTDLGHVTPAVVAGLKGCDALFVEANHDEDLLRSGPYPLWLKDRIASPTGHLSNLAAGELVAAAAGPRTRRVVLIHLSERNNRPALARGEVEAALLRAGRGGIAVEVAGRHGLPRTLEI